MASAAETVYSQAAGWAEVDHGTRLARNVATGTEAANTPATRHHWARRLRLSSAAPPERQADPGQHHRVGQRVGPEELVVRIPPDLLGRVPAGQRLDGGGDAAPVAASDLRADRARCWPLAPPSQPSTVGVRSVSTTMPGCRVEAESSRPAW